MDQSSMDQDGKSGGVTGSAGMKALMAILTGGAGMGAAGALGASGAGGAAVNMLASQGGAMGRAMDAYGGIKSIAGSGSKLLSADQYANNANADSEDIVNALQKPELGASSPYSAAAMQRRMAPSLGVNYGG